MFLVADTFNHKSRSGSLRGALPLPVIQVQLRQQVRTVISMTGLVFESSTDHSVTCVTTSRKPESTFRNHLV